MIRRTSFCVAYVLLIAAVAVAQSDAVRLELNVEPTVASPGQPVTWTITAFDTVPGSLGLSGFSVNFVQSTSNPTPISLVASSVPSPMANFSRPAGLSNPLPTTGATAYGGTPFVSANGGTDLLEIGGVQNTFGVALTPNMGTSTTVQGGVARPLNGQVVATATFSAPSQAGQYCFSLEDALATFLLQVGNPGNPSLVGRFYPTVSTGICFTVSAGPACDPIDFNNDGVSPDSLDIDDFLSVFSGGACSNDPFCNDIDFNNDGITPDSCDIAIFLAVFSGQPCGPCPP